MEQASIKRQFARWVYRRIFPNWVRNALERSIVDLERFDRPRTVDIPPGGRALVLAPHPDDESIGCGGTVRKYVQSGTRVRAVVLTDGRQGDPALRHLARRDPRRLHLENELAIRRKSEAMAALEVLGVEHGYFLDARDGELRQNAATVAAKIADILSDWRPDIVLLPFLTDRHVDHFATNRCFLDAASRLEADWVESMNCLGYETWSPIYANLYVDITATFDCKRRALNCHASQLQSDDFLSGVEGLNRFRAVTGLTGGVYAEAFFLTPLPTYRRLYRQLLL